MMGNALPPISPRPAMRITKQQRQAFIQKLIEKGGEAKVKALAQDLYGNEPQHAITAHEVAQSCKRFKHVALSIDGTVTVTQKGREFCSL